MFRSLFTQNGAAGLPGDTKDKKLMTPSLRSDIYSAIDQVKSWLLGTGLGAVGDGVSFGPIVATIQKHFPHMRVGMEAVGNVEGEVALIVAGITNMILEMSKWEGMASTMAMRTWIDALVSTNAQIAARPDKDSSLKNQIAAGIVKQGVHGTDMSLMTREFTPRIQLISSLKTIAPRIYGQKSEETRQADAVWNSKFI